MTAYKERIEKRGKQLGIEARRGEELDEYASRVKSEEAARLRPRDNVRRLLVTPQGNRFLNHIPPNKRKFVWQDYYVTDERLERPERLVLSILFKHMRSDGARCFPSLELIGEEAGYRSVSRVSKILKKIESLGWIKIRHRGLASGGRASNLYEPRLPEGWEE